MADEVLPGQLVVYSRDVVVAKYLRDYKLRHPVADVGPGTQPYLDAQVFADQQVVLFYNAQQISAGTNLAARGSRLDAVGAAEGIERPEAAGSAGFVSVVTADGGGTIIEGDELLDTATGLRFQCLTTALYANGSAVPIAAIDAGPSTNLGAGTVLEWTSPRAGVGPKAVVLAGADGLGLTGGRDAATDEEYVEVIKEARANPPASGNDAAFRQAVRRTPGLAVEMVFTYPAVKGPGTTCIVFTLKPQVPGGSRLPNGAQIAEVEANLKATFPGDDGIFVAQLVGSQVEIALRIEWKKGAAQWADVVPWPPFVPDSPVRVNADVTPTATAFRLATAVDTAAPQPGQTIGLFDRAKGLWRRKRIKTVSTITANRKWAIVVETVNAASDTSFVPAAGALVSPWSESLSGLTAPVLEAIGALGPGEQFASLPDPGLRRRRLPESPASWPSTITNKAFTNRVFRLPTVADADLLLPQPIPFPTPIGTPATLSYLFELGGFGAFGS